MSIVADSARGLVYFDATSGEYPPTGFSFGVINASTHQVTKVLPLNVSSGPMALDQKTGDVYVAGNTTIAIFDAAEQKFVRQFDVGKPILSMAFDSSVSPDLFITSGHQVFAVNPGDGEVVGNSTFANNVDGLVLDPSNGRLYVGQYPQGGISVLEATSLASIGTIGLPGCCALQFALDDRTQMLYAATGNNYVYALNAGTDTFVKSFQVTSSSQNSTNEIAVDNVTGRVYVASSPGGSILELNAVGDVVQHYQVQSQIAGLAVDTKTQELYATNYHEITVYDAAASRTFLVAIIIGVAVVIAGGILVYIFVKRMEGKERMEVQSGAVETPQAK
jgi:DNA-binding beta-propeller fold protein YncE